MEKNLKTLKNKLELACSNGEYDDAMKIVTLIGALMQFEAAMKPMGQSAAVYTPPTS